MIAAHQWIFIDLKLDSILKLTIFYCLKLSKLSHGFQIQKDISRKRLQTESNSMVVIISSFLLLLILVHFQWFLKIPIM
ncbi:hypothetical protein U3516DRAFT_749228 [Neocallimastix sp. 'constans']